MILISHRGNTNGPTPEENSPTLILDTLALGYHVEIDVWFIDNKFMLGHDKPTYEVDASFMIRSRLWCHAKNVDALIELNKLNITHYFWHQEDDCTLTSSHYIWTYPGKVLTEQSIAVMPELVMDVCDLPRNIAGVCSDYVSQLK